LLIPPFYTAGGNEIRVGHNVFVNQNCSFYDLGGLHIGDDVLTVSPKRGRARMEAISIAFCIGLVLQSVARHADPWTPESRRGQLLPSVRSDRADRFLPPIAIENLDCQSEDRTVVLPSLPQLSPLCGSGKSPSSRLLTVCIDASSGPPVRRTVVEPGLTDVRSVRLVYHNGEPRFPCGDRSGSVRQGRRGDPAERRVGAFC
jgi:hypothetical protein